MSSCFSTPRFFRQGLLIAVIYPPLVVLGQVDARPDKEQTNSAHDHQKRFATAAQMMETAEREMRERLQQNPNDAEANSRLGLIELQKGKLDEALLLLKRAVELDAKSVPLYNNLVFGLLQAHRESEAVETARKAVHLAPENSAAQALLGRALSVMNADIAEAAQHMERSLEISPDQTDLRFDLVNALRKKKDFVGAELQIRILKAVVPPSDPRLEYAEGLLSSDLGHLESAVLSFRRALMSDPHFAPARQDLGAALAKLSRWKEAAEVLGALSQEQPQSSSAAYLHALALQNSSQLEAAETEARRALALNPESADTYTLLGVILAAKGKHAEAAEALAHAVAADPKSFDAQFNLGRERYALGDAASAAENFRAAVQLNAQSAEAHFFLGSVLEIAGDKEAAMAQYQELVRISPNDARGYLGLGSILSKFGNNDDALQELKKARALEPDNFETNMALGRLLAKTGDFTGSVPLLREAVREAPGSPEPHYQLALSLSRLGRNDEARQEFSQVNLINQQRRAVNSPADPTRN